MKAPYRYPHVASATRERCTIGTISDEKKIQWSELPENRVMEIPAKFASHIQINSTFHPFVWRLNEIDRW